MADVKQLPATVNLEIVAGDDWSRLVDFNISLVGYTFEAITSTGVSITVTNTDLSSGQITLSMSDSITQQLVDGSTWTLTWTVSGLTREVFRGNVSII
jgi:hypothetical protein